MTIKVVGTKLVREFGEAEEANKNGFKGNNLGAKKFMTQLAVSILPNL